jgi:hypothetical protein
MPLLVGAAGFAVDTANWTYWRRQLQREADSAAIAGAYAKLQGGDAITAATSDLNRTNTLTLSAPAAIQSAPTTGTYAGNSTAVRVALSTQRRLPFSGSFMSSVPVISAAATAAVIQNGDFCALALGGGSVTGITMQGNASVNFNCDLATNSSNQSKAVIAGGSSSITAGSVSAVGGLPTGSNFASSTKLLPYSPPQRDPYGNLPTVAPPSNCTNSTTVQPNASVTLATADNAGAGACYKGLNIKGNVKFRPGTYYIDGGSLNLGSGANVSIDTSVAGPGGETGVTIILTSSNAASSPSSIATLNVNGGATINLTASTVGTYAGILFYQDRRAQDSGSNTMNGNASSKLQGALYFPSQEIAFSGTSGMITDCLQLVGLRLTFSGNTSIANNCPSGSGAASWKGQQVRLVE